MKQSTQFSKSIIAIGVVIMFVACKKEVYSEGFKTLGPVKSESQDKVTSSMPYIGTGTQVKGTTPSEPSKKPTVTFSSDNVE